ncbi:MAG: DNA-directed RNA polymerase subunit N [Promethearchaeota archaeon]
MKITRNIERKIFLICFFYSFIMIIPIRCFSCGKLIAHIYEPYLEMLEKGESSDAAFKQLGIERWCCKRMVVSHVDLIDDLLKFSRLQ